MGTENIVSIQIPPEVLEKIDTAITSLTDNLGPYLIALSTEEKRELPKMADKTLPFVEKVVEYIKLNPEFTPAYLNVTEMNKDFEAHGQLMGFLRRLKSLIANLEDTALITGSEAYKPALAYYNNVKQAAKMDILMAKTIYNELKKRFEKMSKGTTTEQTPNESNTAK
ncbi:MAG: hypothetical protein WC602_04555 [archaeon]